MGTIAEELQTLAANKAAIKAAIESKNPSVMPTNDMSQWSSAIGSIPSSSLYGIPSLKNLVGDNVNGTLTLPSEPYALDMTGIKVIPDYGLQYKFYGQKISSVSFPDLETIGEYGLLYAFYGIGSLADSDRHMSIAFPKLTSIGKYAFNSTFMGLFPADSFYKRAVVQFDFPAIENINANNIFYRTVYTPGGSTMWDTLTFNFNKLKTIAGNSIFSGVFSPNTIFNPKPILVINMPEVTDITAATAAAMAWFTGLTTAVEIHLYLPKCTSITNTILAPSGAHITYHFGAANQSAIEATDGYANKWCYSSAAYAQVLFDL